MSDVSPALRERLAADLPLRVQVLNERTADRGATCKALLRIGGEHVIGTVLMGYRDRVTVCVSSQVGCAMGCGFCATGQMGLMANLSAGDIAAFRTPRAWTLLLDQPVWVSLNPLGTGTLPGRRLLKR